MYLYYIIKIHFIINKNGGASGAGAGGAGAGAGDAATNVNKPS
jgi:hypothetical protein